MRNRRIKTNKLVLGVLLLASFGVLGGATPAAGVPVLRQDPRQTGGLKKGEAAPDFRLQEASGKVVTLQDFRGKVVYLDFWGSWCRPCLAEAPAAAQLKKQFLGRDILFVYISNETYFDGWLKTIEKYALASPNSVHLLDPEGKHAIRAYNVQGYPTYMIISRSGQVVNGMAPRPSDGRKTVAALERARATR